MKFIRQFREFLKESVNIDQTRLDQLEEHTNAIDDYLTGHDVFEDLVIQTIPQGSWAHQTIIRPQDGKEFDADLLLELSSQPEWKPRDYLSALRRAFSDSDLYKDKVTRKNRCVRIVYAGDCHVDVVPFIRDTDDPGIGNIVCWEDDSYEPTAPEAFTAWFDERNQAAGGYLRRVLRLAKYLRDTKRTFTAKSIILTTLVASQVEKGEQEAAAFTDLPTALRTLMLHLARYLDGHPDYPPSVPDPTIPGATFDHRWPADVAVYKNFRDRIGYYAAKIDDAYSSDDRETSLGVWREVFGSGFASDAAKGSKALVAAPRHRDPKEEFIDDPRYGVTVPDSFPHSVQVHCRVLPKPGFRDGDLRDMRYVTPGRKLRFTVLRCSAPTPYTIYWKIKNTGPVARDAECLRGDIHKENSRSEPTKYRGQHWVECYIVKNGACVAKQRYTVRIR